MRSSIIILFVLLSSWSSAQPELLWTDEIEGDFSFAQNWHYREGIYINRHGQLSCDGFCPPESYQMKDSTGRLISDSLHAFYAIVDTTHISQTIECEARAYQYVFTKDIDCTIKDGQLHAWTLGNSGTHSSLHFKVELNQNEVVSSAIYIRFNSVMNSSGPMIFKAIAGSIEVSRTHLEKGILKAKFDLVFESDPSDAFPLTWKGLILAPVVQL
ncbi:MAG: hypothetical protein ACI865_003375 [Flavobacteriaceae bacterium]|jgi:hypothetical protein